MILYCDTQFISGRAPSRAIGTIFWLDGLGGGGGITGSRSVNRFITKRQQQTNLLDVGGGGGGGGCGWRGGGGAGGRP